MAINRTLKEIVKSPELKDFTDPRFKITIVYGDHDIYEDSKNFVINRHPAAKVWTVENCGHLPWLHNPVKFKEVLREHYGL
jgi:proline iminopeptidase